MLKGGKGMSPSSFYPSKFEALITKGMGKYLRKAKKENIKCSYCEENTPEYYGVVDIAGMFFEEWACERCYKEWQKCMRTPRKRVAPRELSSKFGDYMSGSGGMKGGLSINGRGLST